MRSEEKQHQTSPSVPTDITASEEGYEDSHVRGAGNARVADGRNSSSEKLRRSHITHVVNISKASREHTKKMSV